MDSTDALKSISTIESRYLKLMGRTDEMRKMKEALEKEIAQARFRSALIPEVSAYLDLLLNKANERSINIFQDVLTALIMEILEESNVQVTFDLQIKKSLPALSIALKQNNYLIDAQNAVGGSVTNILSAGLRFIALARSNHRPFIILDEPDCWLNPNKVSKFTGVLVDLAEDIHMQTILISHHDIKLLDRVDHILHIYKTPSGISSQYLTDEPVWKDDQKGIRAIRIKNLMSHADTYLPLSPGVTGITGENHIGKSVVVQAFRLICEGVCNESWIKHGADSTEISVYIENGERIDCIYNPKGKRVLMYRLYDANNTLLLEEPANSQKGLIPDFVSERLKIGPIDDLDVQIGHQKEPVFLMNETATKRAQVLSAGLEGGYIKDMMADYKSINMEDKKVIDKGEKKLTKLIESIDKIDTLLRNIDFEKMINSYRESLQNKQLLSDELNQFEKLSLRIEQLNTIHQLPLPTLSNKPIKIDDFSDDIRLIDRYSMIVNVKNLDKTLPSEFEGIKFVDLSSDMTLCDRYQSISQIKNKEMLLPQISASKPITEISSYVLLIDRYMTYVKTNKELPAIPVLNDIKPSFINEDIELINNTTRIKKELNTLNNDLDTMNKELEVIKKENPECPLCKSKLGKSHQHVQ